MPALLIFLLVFLLTLLPGDVVNNDKKSFAQINQELIAWDNQQHFSLAEFNQRRQDFSELITYYLDQIDHKLSEEEMEHLIKESNRYDIPPEILIKLLKTESNFDKDTIGPRTQYGHAYGIAQFMENTAPWIASMANLEYEMEYLFDPIYSITLAATYLNYLQYGDGQGHEGFHDWHASLTAYNRGVAGLNSYVRNHQTTVSRFSNTIINQAEAIALEEDNQEITEVSFR
ncbi:transglycosylase SLT domain-containing protein [Bacillus horti]|uniref:Soluble lytic murein transglycosylase-like protein n=1 Tax=Caldalkalibacillus horti TaxID=77523 RepID=A0ABT9VT07_9BACI|nr:transglycosylase SLT domain-containing protein [Bacillus horti]MDQ0164123.1 soluble lytic murein transglycosylase-like protein [Bacillus horti]